MLKSKTCEFLTLRDSLIKDRIVLGIISQRVKERLLSEDDLTLQKAMQICQAAEATERQLNKLDTEVTVNYCRGKGPQFVERKKQYNKHKYSENKQNKTLEGHCGKCGGKHEPRKCPTYGRKCNKCSKFNHFARYCTNNK